ncbi:hypothetical protein [Streptomyces sp. NPDC019890]|uniref:hypothetical protein n=1 Tax=Streptomyces sp. NPDC019890 TaxID=3365064 RepID=UPI00385100E9
MVGAACAYRAAREGVVEPPAERRPFAVPVPLSALASLDESAEAEPGTAPAAGPAPAVGHWPAVRPLWAPHAHQ